MHDTMGLQVPPSIMDPQASIFAKHLLAADSYILSMLLMEERELLDSLTLAKIEDKDGLAMHASTEMTSDVPFIEMALADLKARRSALEGDQAPARIGNKDAQGFFYTALPQSEIVHTPSMPSTLGPEVYYYFYMSSDGQQYYLHPLDIRILKHEFKEYALFPDELEVSVMAIQESTIDEV